MMTGEDRIPAGQEAVDDLASRTPCPVRSLILELDHRLMAVFESVLGPEARELPDDAGPGSLEVWDSVNHLSLILAIEAEFGVQFDTAEIPELLTRSALRTRLEQAV